MNLQLITDRLKVPPGRRVNLRRYATDWAGTPELRDVSRDELKDRAKAFIKRNLEDLSEAQELLWASDTHAVLVVFQAMDAAGKDSTIKHVMSGVNPQGCSVHSFKQPSAIELDHTFLWRFAQALPERGRIGIFNRSHYEDVLVVRVHPELLDAAKLPPGKRDAAFWRGRFDDINAFERHLARNGTVILKFFLHLSRDEQKKRFLERLEEPDKNWKFSLGDLKERAYWSQYMKAYEAMLSATSTTWAPWFVVPADNKWVTRAIVAGILTRTIRALKLRYPRHSRSQRDELQKAREQLLNE
jgi:PPK2 family polyphosphate:nucleotide phosphotransferase